MIPGGFFDHIYKSRFDEYSKHLRHAFESVLWKYKLLSSGDFDSINSLRPSDAYMRR